MLAYSSFLPYFFNSHTEIYLQDFSKLKFFRRYCQIVVAKKFSMSYNKINGVAVSPYHYPNNTKRLPLNVSFVYFVMLSIFL